MNSPATVVPTKNRILAATIAAFIMTALLGTGVVVIVEKNRSQEQQKAVADITTRIADNIQDHLSRSISATYALAAIIRQNNGRIDNFEALASEMLGLYDGMSSLALAPQGVVSSIVPLAGNEKAIGHNILEDVKRNKEAILSMKTRKLTLAGPFELVQGGRAVIGRLPVFITAADGTDRFWGFVSVVVGIPRLMKSANLQHIVDSGYHYELSRIHPDSGKRDVFERSAATPLSSPFSHDIEVPNATWTLSIEQTGGWFSPFIIPSEITLVLLVSALISFLLHTRYKLLLTLQQSEERYRTLYKNTPAMLHSTDVNGSLISVSEYWLNVLGYKRDEVIGRKSSEFLTAASQKYAVETAFPEFIKTGYCNNIEYQFVKKNGEVIDTLLSEISERDENGESVRTLAVVTDITERKQTEEQLLSAKAAAEAANTAKSQFLANMSHELRTPMNGLLGMAQLLELTELTSEQQDYVDTLKLSGENLVSLLSDILDLSKIEAGQIILEPDVFSLKQCINDIFLLQKFVAHEKGLKLRFEVAEEIPHLLVGDQFRIKQILLNLLGNAVKFTAAGGVTVSAHLLEQHATTVLVRIDVRDTGIGIAAEAFDLIFKAFTQEDGSMTRKYGGTGLGLTISRKLAELLGGTITVESTLGVGSCFRVTLPFRIGSTIGIPQKFVASTAPEWDGPSLRVLLVDDDEGNTKFGVALLKRLGQSVTTAENGRQCLVALENGEFDIVLMDIQMPVMNGEEAMREIREQEKGTTTHLPIIALTAHSMRGEKERLLQVGFDGYVSKPLMIKDLVAEMKRAIRL